MKCHCVLMVVQLARWHSNELDTYLASHLRVIHDYTHVNKVFFYSGKQKKRKRVN
jgi:CRISPR/Cas system-associated protein Csm6